MLLIFSDANDEAIQYKKLEAGGLLVAVYVVLIISVRLMRKASYCDAGPRNS